MELAHPFVVRPITLEETYPLRLKVLRPNGVLADRHFQQDGIDHVFHLGVMHGDECISIGSFYPEAHGSFTASRPYRLRGMATDPAYQGKGAGHLLMLAALGMLQDRGADLLWCNARIKAVPFYERLGLATKGEVFDIPGIGPHYLMYRHL